MTTFDLKPQQCPTCHTAHTACTAVADHAAQHRPGDYSVCLECQAVGVFDEQLVLRKITDQERHEMSLELRAEIRKIQKAMVLTKLNPLVQRLSQIRKLQRN